jgi:hypothetical protein
LWYINYGSGRKPGMLGTELPRDVTTPAAVGKDSQDAIDYQTADFPLSAPLAVGRKYTLDLLPLGVR